MYVYIEAKWPVKDVINIREELAEANTTYSMLKRVKKLF